MTKRNTGGETPFWKTKALAEMTPAEWESLCDGCGKCCLSKLEDEDTGEIIWTSVVCRLFDAKKCRCKDYAHRNEKVPDCVRLTPENVLTIPWLPKTCAYRLIGRGEELPDWHPLVAGNAKAVHDALVSVRGKITAFEDDLAEAEDYFLHVLDEEP
ncbi:MAG: YcgN family cysteine cluster protein [Phyllobacteriaceae bacterium]|nr:YcgN family cysteine cluster protein [Phyllobacteriaceae bacterium]